LYLLRSSEPDIAAVIDNGWSSLDEQEHVGLLQQASDETDQIRLLPRMLASKDLTTAGVAAQALLKLYVDLLPDLRTYTDTVIGSALTAGFGNVRVDEFAKAPVLTLAGRRRLAIATVLAIVKHGTQRREFLALLPKLTVLPPEVRAAVIRVALNDPVASKDLLSRVKAGKLDQQTAHEVSQAQQQLASAPDWNSRMDAFGSWKMQAWLAGSGKRRRADVHRP
jgi:hypothetical protein